MKLNKRAVALLVSLVMLLSAAVGATVAYIIDRTENMDNTFTPSRVACEVLKEQEDYKYTVKNTGDTAAYIRVAVVVNWKNSDGHVYAKAPEFEVPVSDGWENGSDGYYYFTKPVAVGAKTDSELTVNILTDEPDGYDLYVEVVASAIQATSAAVNDWSNGVAAAG